MTALLTPDAHPADVLLADGSLAVVRAAVAGDAAALHDLHERVSDEALRLRFFSLVRRTAHKYVDQVLASHDTLALVVEIDGRVVALGTAEPLTEDVCEVAFLVDDDQRGRGIATLLLEHLAAETRERGVRRLVAEVMGENHRMLEVFADVGFQVHHHIDGGIDALEMDNVLTPRLQDAADRREFAAEARSLAPMLAPRSVAVYGVRRDGTGIGAAVLHAVLDGGYRGEVTVVHPTADAVAGVQAVASLALVPRPVDLAIIAVPAAHAVEALEDAASAHVPAAVVISSGFSEMGDEGARLQHRLSEVARARGVRVVGPNCLGLLSNDVDVRLNATFGGAAPGPGGLAVASQSGGVGIVLMDLVARAGVGVRSFVSLGNKADVSSNDLLAAWYEDPAVTCAALYLESFGNARKFARFARRFSERKPLVAVVGGRSSGGRRAGVSHTAAAASPEVGVRALFAQAGVIGCHDAEELAESTLLLTREPLPQGGRVAILSNAGGLGILAADAADDEGLDVVELSAALRARLGAMVHQTLGTANPVDAGAGAEPEQLAGIAELILASGEVDALVAVLVATGTNDLDGTLRALGRARSAHPDLPVLAVALGQDITNDTGTTTFRSATAALGALGRVVTYAAWRRIPTDAPTASDPADVHRMRTDARALLATGPPAGWLPADRTQYLLGRYGIDLSGTVVSGADAAVHAATALGLPVAVKVAAADVVHRTELGLVLTGLGSEEQVRRAVQTVERVHGAGSPVMVQPMAEGVEMAVGLVRDRGMGPLVMLAAGGVATEVWHDHAFLLPPFSAAEALRAMRSLRTWPLLDGFRGAAPAATGELARLVAEVGRLAVDVPEVAELDLNPVLVGLSGCTVVDAKLRLAAPDQALRDQPRQLRRVR